MNQTKNSKLKKNLFQIFLQVIILIMIEFGSIYNPQTVRSKQEEFEQTIFGSKNNSSVRSHMNIDDSQRKNDFEKRKKVLAQYRQSCEKRNQEFDYLRYGKRIDSMNYIESNKSKSNNDSNVIIEKDQGFNLLNSFQEDFKKPDIPIRKDDKYINVEDKEIVVNPSNFKYTNDNQNYDKNSLTEPKISVISSYNTLFHDKEIERNKKIIKSDNLFNPREKDTGTFFNNFQNIKSEDNKLNP